jgi:FG-GAP repeat/IPT/TIG domain
MGPVCAAMTAGAIRLRRHARKPAIATASALAILSLLSAAGTAAAASVQRVGRSMALAQAPASLQAAVRTTLAGQAITPPGWHATELIDPPGLSEGATFGWSVAISGSTAVVGTIDGLKGQAYIYVQSGADWVENAKFTGSPGFGVGVATDGSTVAVGSPGVNSQTGAVFVFARSGRSWTQQAKLTATGGVPSDELGASVAMSGNTIVAGAPGVNSDKGALYVFTESGSVWSQQAELTASDGASNDGFGGSVSGPQVPGGIAISGSTVVAGAPGHAGTGAAYVFTPSGGPWAQQAEVKASDAATNDAFGSSVAISNQTAIVGAPEKGNFVGAAYVFGQSGAMWTQRAELTPGTNNPPAFGFSVAIDGSTAAVGAPSAEAGATGAVFMYTGSGANWRRTATLRPSDTQPDDLGSSVALSGSSVLVGAEGQGAAYVFTDYGVPTVTRVAPASGPVAGGNTVTINGSHFVAGLTTVDFGSVASPSVTVISPSRIQAVAPAAASAGSVDVTVTTPGGTSKKSARDMYAYG